MRLARSLVTLVGKKEREREKREEREKKRARKNEDWWLITGLIPRVLAASRGGDQICVGSARRDTARRAAPG